MLELPEIFDVLNEFRDDEVVIATMTAGYLWPHYSKSSRDFAYTAPMGSAGAIGLGLSLARPDVTTIVLDGDGSVLMNLGVLATIGAESPSNLVHVIIQNGVYSITGGQPLPGHGTISITGIALACGIRNAFDVSTPDQLRVALDNSRKADGPTAIVADSAPYPRSRVTAEMAHREASLSRRTKTGFRNLRQQLATSSS